MVSGIIRRRMHRFPRRGLRMCRRSIICPPPSGGISTQLSQCKDAILYHARERHLQNARYRQTPIRASLLLGPIILIPYNSLNFLGTLPAVSSTALTVRLTTTPVVLTTSAIPFPCPYPFPFPFPVLNASSPCT